MSGPRFLIVNADDFGRSPGINRGIMRAHREGVVTSASMMVRWPSAAEAAEYALAHADLSVGLHVDLGEWTCREHVWVETYQVVACEDQSAVAEEVLGQLNQFRQLLGREPTHIDSHQHVHRDEPARSVFRAVASELGIPLRHVTPKVRYCGLFYGQNGKGLPYPEAISVNSLLRVFESLEAGVTELACHPGEAAEPDWMYGAEREQEVETLCHPRVREFLRTEGIELTSFHHIRMKA
jgi:predicted glycoside hydrolase/deacetylase ChbG (UPF0249 family)